MHECQPCLNVAHTRFISSERLLFTMSNVGGWCKAPRCKCKKIPVHECWLLIVRGTHSSLVANSWCTFHQPKNAQKFIILGSNIHAYLQSNRLGNCTSQQLIRRLSSISIKLLILYMINLTQENSIWLK